MTEKQFKKKQLIISEALKLLSEQGEESLSVRRLAKELGMSLSNVQYYFKNRDALLQGIIEYYVSEYSKSLKSSLEIDQKNVRLTQIIKQVLVPIDKDMDYRVFRMLWNIAERDNFVKTTLEAFYSDFLKIIKIELQNLGDGFQNNKRLTEVSSILLTSIEGYYTLKDVIPISTEAYIDLITETLIVLASSEKTN